MTETPKDDSAAARVHTLTPWRATLRRSAIRHRLGDATSPKEVQAGAQALSSLESYHLVKEVGASEASSLLHVLNADQIRTLFDLDIWHAHELDASDLLLWLQAFRDAGPETLGAALRALDPEALALFLRTRIEIALRPTADEGEEEPDSIPEWVKNPNSPLAPVAETPDGRFWIAARPHDRTTEQPVDDEERKGILFIVDECFRSDGWEDFAGIMRLAYDELSHELAEDAYRFRVARLEDLGFSHPERAFALYEPLQPAGLWEPAPDAIPAHDAQLPLAYVAPLKQGLFDAAMDGLEDPRRVRRIEGDLVALLNAAIAADGVAPANREAVQAVVSATRGLIELALAHGVTPKDRVSVARARLGQRHISTLFRIGYGLTLNLKARAQKLAKRPTFFAGETSLGRLDVLSRAVLEALMLRRPRVCIADDRSEPEPIGSRPFESADDLARIDGILTELEGLADWLDSSGWVIDADRLPEHVAPELSKRTVDVLFATALLHVLHGDRASVLPFGPDQVRRWASGAWPPAVGPSALRVAFEGLPPESIGRIERAFEALSATHRRGPGGVGGPETGFDLLVHRDLGEP